MKPGAWILIREPTTSMGNWYEKRQGLTPCERGIPTKLMLQFFNKCGLSLRYTSPCDFSVLQRFLNKIGIEANNNIFCVWLDAMLSLLFQFNQVYYPKNVLQKIRPGTQFYICQK
jgi:hypothetical protein